MHEAYDYINISVTLIVNLHIYIIYTYTSSVQQICNYSHQKKDKLHKPWMKTYMKDIMASKDSISNSIYKQHIYHPSAVCHMTRYLNYAAHLNLVL